MNEIWLKEEKSNEFNQQRQPIQFLFFFSFQLFLMSWMKKKRELTGIAAEKGWLKLIGDCWFVVGYGRGTRQCSATMKTSPINQSTSANTNQNNQRQTNLNKWKFGLAWIDEDLWVIGRRPICRRERHSGIALPLFLHLLLFAFSLFFFTAGESQPELN